MEAFEVSNGVMIYYLPQELDHFAADRIKRKTESCFKDGLCNKHECKYR